MIFHIPRVLCAGSGGFGTVSGSGFCLQPAALRNKVAHAGPCITDTHRPNPTRLRCHCKTTKSEPSPRTNKKNGKVCACECARLRMHTCVWVYHRACSWGVIYARTHAFTHYALTNARATRVCLHPSGSLECISQVACPLVSSARLRWPSERAAGTHTRTLTHTHTYTHTHTHTHP